jgi:hypothetical protein
MNEVAINVLGFLSLLNKYDKKTDKTKHVTSRI